MRQELLDALQKGPIDDTDIFARQNNFDHNELVGVINSLVAHSIAVSSKIEKSQVALTQEAEEIIEKGSPEYRLFQTIEPSGSSKASLEAKLGAKLLSIALGKAMQNKWVSMDKATSILTRSVASVEDSVAESLKKIAQGSEVPDRVVADLKKRKMVQTRTVKSFKVEQGPQFEQSNKKFAADLTVEMLAQDQWKDTVFKLANFNALGVPPESGFLHPLMKVRAEYREIFLEMGFEEMPTNMYVESSFWNFDTLFQPQQHPARDAHDTFFLKDPEFQRDAPSDYVKRVHEMHENGGSGSIGWRYPWSLEESNRNILRTHTTACSSRMLYKLAQDGFKPAKYFSIDRVFRNESLDATHLAEFHQIEGLICDYNVNLSHLIGVLHQFFSKTGITNLKFKPAYNPYTEPSMEVFSYHPGLKKLVEIGNSGVFRPEMLLPMGLPENVSVIAWGLSLERPTMIRYGFDNIRDIFGHKIDLQTIKTAPICMLERVPLQ